jgi:hypothetical protein
MSGWNITVSGWNPKSSLTVGGWNISVAHPVWGYKNIKQGGVGWGRRGPPTSIVRKGMCQTVCWDTCMHPEQADPFRLHEMYFLLCVTQLRFDITVGVQRCVNLQLDNDWPVGI